MDYTFPEKFHKAAELFDHIVGDLELTSQLDNDHKLMFYALRQQAERGPCTEPAPSVWRFVERHKHAAWCKLGKMSNFEAMVHFVRHAELCLFPGEKDVNWGTKYRLILGEPTPAHSGDAGTPWPDQSTLVTSELLEDPSLWDDDLQAHGEPTPENLVYLATQAVFARRQCEALLASIDRKVPSSSGHRLSASQEEAAAGRSTGLMAAPHVHRGSGASVAVCPPGTVNTPGTVSAAPGQTMPTPDDSEDSMASSPRPPSSSWMDWFGW